MDIPEFGIKRENEEPRNGGCGIVYDPNTGLYAVGQERESGLYRLFSGGVDEGEDIQMGVQREVEEESGLHDFLKVEKVAEAITHYRNNLRKVNRVAHATCFLFVLNTTNTKEVRLEEHETFDLVWVNEGELLANWHAHNANHDVDHWIYFLESARRLIAK